MRLRALPILLLATWIAGACAAPGTGGPAIGGGFAKVAVPLIADGKPYAFDTEVSGYLFKPEGAGPFPAVILIHGCNGLDWSRPRQPGWLLLKGYA